LAKKFSRLSAALEDKELIAPVYRTEILHSLFGFGVGGFGSFSG